MHKTSLMTGILLSCFALGAFAENEESAPPKANAITIGLLQGGGGLIGFDYERLVFGGTGIQVGVGFLSAGAGLTFHFDKETTDSNALWVGVWNQGMPGSETSATYVGVSYIMRGWGWLNGQIGIAYVPFRGDEVTKALKDLTGQEPPRVALLYSLGWYSGF